MATTNKPLTPGGKAVLIVIGILLVLTILGIFSPSSHNPSTAATSSGGTGSTGATGSSGVTGLAGDPSYTQGYNVGAQDGTGGTNGNNCQTLWNNVGGSGYQSKFNESSWLQGCGDAVAVNSAAG